MKKQYALPISIMFALFFTIAFVTGLQNPMGVIIKSQFSTSNLLSQLGNFANFIAYAFMGIPAGIMLQRIGCKRTALTAIVTGMAGIGIMYLAGVKESYGIYLTGAFVSGFSMCMLNTVVNPMLKSLGASEKRGNQLIQFGGACNSIGATIAPVLVGYLMGGNEALRTIAKADPALYIALGVFMLAFIVILLNRLPEPYVESRVTSRESFGKIFRRRQFTLGVAAIFIYVGIEVGIPNIGNLYMTQQLGMDSAAAGSVVGTYWLLMLAGRLIGGSVGGRVSDKSMLSFTAAVGIVLVTLSMLLQRSSLTINLPVFMSDISFSMEPVRISLLCLVLCGMATSVMWGAIFSLAVSGLGKYTPAASGIFMTMVCGGGILPALQGWIADRSSYMSSFWLILAGFVFILYYAWTGGDKRKKH